MVVQQGQRLRLKLVGYTPLGDALAFLGEKPVHVLGGIAGEEVEVEVVRERRDYVAARVVEVLEPSLYRVRPPCPYFGECTGCQWQHMAYEHQLELKREVVAQALRTAGLSDAPVASTSPAAQQYGYRNHARFTVRWGGHLGFVHRESRRFVSIDECLLMDAAINQAVRQLQGRCAETRQVSVRYGVRTGSLLIQPSLRNPEVPLPSGQKQSWEQLGGVSFRVSASSFFQVNTVQAERLVDLVREALGLSGREEVVDAYAGVGTFAALLAPLASRVLAIEEAAAAVKDARENLAPFRNVEIIESKTEAALAALSPPVDAVVLDPPRAGCSPEALSALLRLSPTRVVYVSCDPETLARDLGVLVEGGYRLEKVQPMDMFPQTHHVECVTSLRHERPKG
ncbi:MAG: 23S rRNA (uracil(1939)-C(5))-methyltransferase RlmD [Chloroflexi bacterium]|nr:23S rRNA (uracil(1939)-C(5))-methyltransferase RlmD [Chloroflexota bacterium]